MPRYLLGLVFLISSTLPAATRTDEYALILEDKPLSHDGGVMSLRGGLLSAKQSTLTDELTRRGIRARGSVRTLLNAVFIAVPHGERPNVTGLPGVASVVYLPPLRRHLNKALDLVRVTAAWNDPRIGGVANAGAGVKIGIIDTGIEDFNPAFSGAGFPAPPSGFPKGLTAYTSNKIIVARTYVDQLSSADPQYSSPDDTTPVDHAGHGTVVAMIAGGETVSGPAATITGVAPHAWLGNYKVFGSPGVNDFTTASAIILALEDALADGMDVVTLAVGVTALYGATEENSVCHAVPTRGYYPSDSCDVQAQAVEHAVAMGMTVVVSAGDDGDSGFTYPTLGTINSPGTAPSAITVGATTNAHTFVATVFASAPGLPANLQQIDAKFGASGNPTGPIAGPLADVTKTGNDGTACSPLPQGSLAGTAALVIRGNCDFATKSINVQAAGAFAMVLYLDNPNDFIFVPVQLQTAAIPVVLISNASGTGLKSALAATPVHVTLDPGLFEESAVADEVAAFSSRGPTILTSALKPEIAAPGTDLYAITETLDTNGTLWSASGFNSAQGASFAVPLVAGGVALVKQAHPTFTAGQLKSAVVNSANSQVFDGGVQAGVTVVGAGKLDAANALNVAATAEPAVLSFGDLTVLPTNASFLLTNVSTANTTFSLSVNPRYTSNIISASVSPSSVTLSPGTAATITMTLSGSSFPAGSYEGLITITGAGPALHVPYLFLVSSGTPSNIFPVLGDGLTGATGQTHNLVAFRVVDQFGVAVASQPVTFQVVQGNSVIDTTAGVDSQTDGAGLAAANVTLDPAPGAQVIQGNAGALTWQFNLNVITPPQINSGGIVNGGSFIVGQGFAPGSYISIFGTNLAATVNGIETNYLPPSLSDVSVSFDVPSANLSYPGEVVLVSPGQINVQVPWELAGQTSAIVKVARGTVVSLITTIPLNNYSPGFFEYTDAGNNKVVVAALDVNYHLIGAFNPVPQGGVAQIYINGLGPVDQQQFSGYPATSPTAPNTTARPTVTIGGVNAPVLFSGLSPNSIGLYQVNVQIPTGLTSGVQPLKLTIGGVAAKDSQISVK